MKLRKTKSDEYPNSSSAFPFRQWSNVLCTRFLPTAMLGLAALGAALWPAEADAASRIKLIKLMTRAGETSVVSVAALRAVAPDFDGKSFVMTTSDAETLEADARAVIFRPIPAQGDDLDGNGTVDEIAFMVEPQNLRVRRVVTLAYGDEAAIAPLRVTFPRRAHAAFSAKYEGLGWENDRQAWRIYFDARNAIDLFGKRQHALALDYFAQPGVNYHEESPFGRDIYKNGDALGIGSIGAYVDGKVIKVSNVTRRSWRVVADGPLRAIAEMRYEGWKVGGRSVDLTSRLTIWAGQHGFEHLVTARGAEGLQLVTSLPVKPGLSPMTNPAGDPRARGRFYLATWGKQVLRTGATASASLPDQNLGLAVALPPSAVAQPDSIKDPNNHLVKLSLNENGQARFLVLAGWDQEAPDDRSTPGLDLDPALMLPHAARSAEAWERYVEEVTRGLPTAPETRVQILSKTAAPATPPADAQASPGAKSYAEAIALVRGDIDRTAQKLAARVPLPFFVNRNNASGEWSLERGPGWTGSFWIGQLWLMHRHTGDAKYAGWARRWNDPLLGQESKQNHDTGFLNYYSSAFAHEATKAPKYRQGAIRSAQRLQELYNPRTQLIAAWNVRGEDSIIDTMMNLQIWWWAAKETGDNAFLELGRAHALRSAEWLVRPDGSVIQSVHYDPDSGRRRFGHTHQGFGAETAWGRGTGWGLYGFAIAARETRDPRLQAAAERIAAFVINRLPDDGVPWHDYHDEGVYFRIKDTSAGALAANGLFLLAEMTTDKAKATTYRATGERIVQALVDHYLTPTHAGDATPPGALRHGSGARPHDGGLIFGDYYLLEALLWLNRHGIARR